MRKRSKYKPKGIRYDNVGFVKASISTGENFEPLKDIRTGYHFAMKQLVLGEGTKDDVDMIVNAANLAKALIQIRVGLGGVFVSEVLEACDHIKRMAERGLAKGRFLFTGEEMESVNYLLMIHDTQLAAATLGEVDKAVEIMNKHILSGNAIKIKSPENTI